MEEVKSKKVGIASRIYEDTRKYAVMGEVNLIAKTLETMFEALRKYELDNKIALKDIMIESKAEEDHIYYKISTRTNT